MLGLRTRARSAERARTQWERALGGTVTQAEAGELVFRWPRSPMRIAVDVVPDALEEGPTVIEIGPVPTVALPPGPIAPFGATFGVDRNRPEA